MTSYRAEWQVDPEDEGVPFRLGRVHYKMGRYDESLEYLKKAEADALHAEVFRYLGGSCMRKWEKEMRRWKLFGGF